MTSAPPPTDVAAIAPQRPAVTVKRIIQASAAMLLATALVVWLIPKVADSDWATLGRTIQLATPTNLAILVLVWFLGLAAHSYVLTAALPGLSNTRGLALNLTGSAVSNVAPMGGALGIATNLLMVRHWGFRDAAFVAFTIVTNIWDVLAKLILPIVALATLVSFGVVGDPRLKTLAIVAVLAIVVVVAISVWALIDDAAAHRLAGWLQRTSQRLLPARWAKKCAHIDQSILNARDLTQDVVQAKWRQLSLGMIGYIVLQGLLLGICLDVVGASVGWYIVLAGYAVERILSLALITPGGVGFTEVGTIAVLVSLGGAAVPVAAGVLLYRIFTFVLEIPVGGVWLAVWWVRRTKPAEVAS